MNVGIRLNTKDAERAIRQLRDAAPAAIARALNRSAASGQTVMVREIGADMGLRQKDVREGITVQEARPTSLVARIIATGKRVPLMDFSARQTKRKGVTAKLKGGAGRYPQAFIRTMGSGHRGVFQRRGQARLPITELHGPSVGHVFEKHLPAGMARALEQLAKNLKSELAYALRRGRG